MKQFLNVNSDQAFDLMMALQEMMASRDESVCFTEEQFQFLAKTSGVPISDFNNCFHLTRENLVK